MTSLIRRRTMVLSAAMLACSSPSMAQQRTSDAVLHTVRARAAAAGFEGTILIGERDGSSRTITVGRSPVRANAVWRWASITKQLTAVIAMQEVAAGRLDLDAPVSRYWPDWSAPSARTIRIRDLLLHNSGLRQPDEATTDADALPPFYGSSAATPAASAAGFCAGPARASAPAGFEYNNCDAIVLGEVLSRITGRSFEALVRERIAAPLGMSRFGIYALGPSIRGHVTPTGESRALDSLMNLGVYGAAGGAYGTIGDLWRFDHALLSGRLLRNAERGQMWTSSPQNGFSGFFQWIFEAPLKGCDGARRIVERRGQIGGIEHRNVLLPESGQAVIMFGRHLPLEYGEVWQGRGLMYDVLSAVSCRS